MTIASQISNVATLKQSVDMISLLLIKENDTFIADKELVFDRNCSGHFIC